MNMIYKNIASFNGVLADEIERHTNIRNNLSVLIWFKRSIFSRAESFIVEKYVEVK